MPMLDFDELTKEQADAFLEQTMADHQPAIASLAARLASDHVDLKLDADPAGLVPLWEWFVRWFEGPGSREAAGEDAPRWYLPQAGDGMPLRVPALVVVDEIGHYLAETVIQNVPGVQWHVARRPKRVNYAYQNMPALDIDGTDLVPSWPVRALATRLAMQSGAREPDSLLAIYDIYAAA